MPVNTAPPTILPSVTGIWFQNSHCPTVMSAPRRMAVGMTNMFTMECSKAKAKKVETGNQIATTLPVADVETMPRMVPIATIQLHNMPLTKAVNQPFAPACSYTSVLDLATAMIFSPSAPCPSTNASVKAIASSNPTKTQPKKFPIYTQVQLRNSLSSVVLPRSTPTGSTAKLPVASSMPSNMIMAKPTGKTAPETSAPTFSGRPAETLNARAVPYARSAPDMKPLTNIVPTSSPAFFLLAASTSSMSFNGG